MGRRRALQVIGIGLGTAGGLVAFAGCSKGADPGSGGQGAKPAGATGTCMDKVAVDDTAKQMRKTLQYKEKSDTPEKKCSLCAQYEAGKFGECGGCKLFAGGVSPEGACLSFAPKNPATPPGVAPTGPPGVAPTPAPAAPAPAVPTKG